MSVKIEKRKLNNQTRECKIRNSSLGALEERLHYDVVAPHGGLERADQVGSGEDLARLLPLALVVEQHRRGVQQDLVLAREVVHAPRRVGQLACEELFVGESKVAKALRWK